MEGGRPDWTWHVSASPDPLPEVDQHEEPDQRQTQRGLQVRIEFVVLDGEPGKHLALRKQRSCGRSYSTSPSNGKTTPSTRPSPAPTTPRRPERSVSPGQWRFPLQCFPRQGNGDNVFVTVEPGRSFRYDYRLPEDHPPGVHWYHPHHHGMVADQVFGGLSTAPSPSASAPRYRSPANGSWSSPTSPSTAAATSSRCRRWPR